MDRFVDTLFYKRSCAEIGDCISSDESRELLEKEIEYFLCEKTGDQSA